MLEIISLFFKRLKCFPHFIFLVFKDLITWLRVRGWTVFTGWGLHIYLGSFGAGKTCSAIRDCYNYCLRYKNINVLTNINLSNFPKDTIITPLRCGQDILNAPNNTIVLIDEIGTIFNSRDFKANGRGIPKPIFQHLCQCRHRNMMILATAQEWGFVDKALRQITATVTVCSSWFAHPFSRMITNRVYNAREYDLFYNNPMLPLTTVSSDVYVQTDKLRSLYDTREMVDNMLQMEYVPDDEIDLSRGDIAVQPSISGDKVDKKVQQKLLNKMKKGGIT